MAVTLADYTTDELREELARRGQREVCRCGPNRKEYRSTQQGFHDRTGCLVCNLWDGPVTMNGARTW